MKLQSFALQLQLNVCYLQSLSLLLHKCALNLQSFVLQFYKFALQLQLNACQLQSLSLLFHKYALKLQSFVRLF